LKNGGIKMGRRRKELIAALWAIIESGMTSMNEGNYWYHQEEDFNFEDVEEAYLLILKVMKLD
jgi:hypothetical protein